MTKTFNQHPEFLLLATGREESINKKRLTKRLISTWHNNSYIKYMSEEITHIHIDFFFCFTVIKTNTHYFIHTSVHLPPTLVSAITGTLWYQEVGEVSLKTL